MADDKLRPLKDEELKKANEKHAKPEFLPAGKDRFVVVINEDGLKKLRDDKRLTKEQYDAIKKEIDAGDKKHNNHNAYKVGAKGERNRYSIMFEGASADKAMPTYAMSGQLNTMIVPDGRWAGTNMELNSGLNLKKKGATADREDGRSLHIGLNADFTLQDHRDPNDPIAEKRDPGTSLGDHIKDWPDSVKEKKGAPEKTMILSAADTEHQWGAAPKTPNVKAADKAAAKAAGEPNNGMAV